MNDFPFSEVKTQYGCIRTFDETTNNECLIWHRDRNTRLIRVIESKEWYFQRDN